MPYGTARPGALLRKSYTLHLGVDRNHWLLRRQSRRDALIDVDELSVPVGMIASLLGLAVGLEVELPPFE
jgi:hypothetical protein